MPWRNGCLTSFISVTRSAASISSGLALRPVTTTCRSGRLAARASQDLGQGQGVVAEDDVELVQDHQVQLRILQHGLGLAERGAGGGDVLGAVLGLPGEAVAHHLDRDQLGEALEEQPLARHAAALDELDHAQLEAMAEAAHGQPPGRRALALAGAGMDDQEALLAGLGGVQPVLGRLDPGHLGAVLGFGLCILGHATVSSPMVSAPARRAGRRRCCGAAARAPGRRPRRSAGRPRARRRGWPRP